MVALWGIFKVGEEFLKWLNILVPATLVIIAIIIASSITKGYRGFISGIAELLKSKWSFLFFVIILIAFIYFWTQAKQLLNI